MGIVLSNLKIIDSSVLRLWYNEYKLSAVIADVLSLMIGLIITRAIYYYVFDEFSMIKFILLAVAVQITHDILFYLFFTSVPRGLNRMLDTFKDYAIEASYKAIISDSIMIISTCLIMSYLANLSVNANIIILIITVYILQYVLYW